MIGLIREWLKLMVKRNWLKHINREVKKYNSLNEKARVQAYIVHKMVEQYNELYPSDKIMAERKDTKK